MIDSISKSPETSIPLDTRTLSLRIAAVLAMSVALPATVVMAQQPGGAVALPPVVVEGATLAKPVARIAKPVQPQDAEPDQPAAAAKKAAKSAKAKQQATPSVAGTALTAVDPAAAVPLAPEPNAIERGVASDTLGTAVSVVTGAELKAQQVRHAADALRSLPGVSVSEQGGPGRLNVVRIRGAESNHTLVVIDGVEVNSATDGLYDFSNLSADNIERIEVLRGPQSGLYGTGALGGVVNIVTKSGKGPLTLIGETEAGSFATKSGRVGISGGTERAWGAVLLGVRETDGIDISPVGTERDGSSLRTLSFKGGISPLADLVLRGSFRASKAQTDRDGFNGFAAVDGFYVADDDASTTASERWSGRLDADYKMLGGALVHNLFAWRSNSELTDVDRSFGTSVNVLEDTVTTYGYNSTLRIGAADGAVRHFVTGLVEQRDEEFSQREFATFDISRGRTSIAGEVRGEYFDTLHVTTSLRHDDNDSIDDYTSWRTQGSLKVPSTPFRLHASYGTGVKYPSFAELHGSFLRYTPNPNLRPEESRGWDAGVETTLLAGRAVVDVTYFKADLENEIVDDFSLFPLITSVNLAGKSERQGIEVAGRFRIVDGVVLGGSYTWLDASAPTGAAEIRRPEHQGRLDIDWAFHAGRGHLNLAAIYNGEMKDVGFAVPFFTPTTVTLDDYWLLRLAGSYEVAPGVELFGRVENLLDQRYQEVFGYETAGAAAFAGVRLKLEAPVTR